VKKRAMMMKIGNCNMVGSWKVQIGGMWRPMIIKTHSSVIRIL